MVATEAVVATEAAEATEPVKATETSVGGEAEMNCIAPLLLTLKLPSSHDTQRRKGL